jgi:hypothetical protein
MADSGYKRFDLLPGDTIIVNEKALSTDVSSG